MQGRIPRDFHMPERLHSAALAVGEVCSPGGGGKKRRRTEVAEPPAGPEPEAAGGAGLFYTHPAAPSLPQTAAAPEPAAHPGPLAPAVVQATRTWLGDALPGGSELRTAYEGWVQDGVAIRVGNVVELLPTAGDPSGATRIAEVVSLASEAVPGGERMLGSFRRIFRCRELLLFATAAMPEHEVIRSDMEERHVPLGAVLGRRRVAAGLVSGAPLPAGADYLLAPYQYNYEGAQTLGPVTGPPLT
jgi:hypothetical protein